MQNLLEFQKKYNKDNYRTIEVKFTSLNNDHIYPIKEGRIKRTYNSKNLNL